MQRYHGRKQLQAVSIPQAVSAIAMTTPADCCLLLQMSAIVSIPQAVSAIAMLQQMVQLKLQAWRFQYRKR